MPSVSSGDTEIKAQVNERIRSATLRNTKARDHQDEYSVIYIGKLCPSLLGPRLWSVHYTQSIAMPETIKIDSILRKWLIRSYYIDRVFDEKTLLQKIINQFWIFGGTIRIRE